MTEAFRRDLRVTLTKMLPRLRLSLPFPLDPDEVFREAFGGGAIAEALILSPTPVHGARRNLQLCVRLSRTVPFTLSAQQEPHEEQMFWIRYPEPRASSAPLPLLLPYVLSNDVRLRQWHAQAMAMEAEIEAFNWRIYETVNEINSPYELVHAWPEVVPAVSALLGRNGVALVSEVRRGHRSRISLLRKKVVSKFPTDDMARLGDMLTTAIMLPDELPTAWIDNVVEGGLR